MKNIDLKLVGIIVGVVVAIFVLLLFIANGPKNKAISLEENVTQAKSDITIVEKKRNDLIPRLAECVKEYDKHEAETLMAIVKERKSDNATDEDMNEVNNIINVVAEAYPELKSNENYKSLMESIELNENSVARYRENYNTCVTQYNTQYNTYVRKFPNDFFLSITHYEIMKFDKLSYDVDDTLGDIF